MYGARHGDADSYIGNSATVPNTQKRKGRYRQWKIKIAISKITISLRIRTAIKARAKTRVKTEIRRTHRTKTLRIRLKTDATKKSNSKSMNNGHTLFGMPVIRLLKKSRIEVVNDEIGNITHAESARIGTNRQLIIPTNGGSSKVLRLKPKRVVKPERQRFNMRIFFR